MGQMFSLESKGAQMAYLLEREVKAGRSAVKDLGISVEASLSLADAREPAEALFASGCAPEVSLSSAAQLRTIEACIGDAVSKALTEERQQRTESLRALILTQIQEQQLVSDKLHELRADQEAQKRAVAERVNELHGILEKQSSEFNTTLVELRCARLLSRDGGGDSEQELPRNA